MNVFLTTNLDRYKISHFPDKLEIPPRIGERVYVKIEYQQYYLDQHLPIELEVTMVNWTSGGASVELWYTQTAFKSAKLNNINLF